MFELTDRIREISGSDLAREVFVAPAGYTLKREYIEGEKTQQDILDVLLNFNEFYGLFHDLFTEYRRSCETGQEGFGVFQLQWEDDKDMAPYPQHLLEREDYFSHLSMTLDSNDLRQFMGSFVSGTRYLDVLLHKYDEIEEANKLLRKNPTYLAYDILRIVFGIIPYIAVGDCSGLISIEESSFQEHLTSLENMLPTPNITINKPEVKSDEFWIMKQMYKNAGQATNRKFDLDHPERSVSVGIADDVLYVEDNGDGIPAEVLNSIFGIYTSGGTGLGLQMVKRIVDLRDGQIVVASTEEGKDTFQYDTRTDQVTKLDETQPRGTKFEVYLGKKE
jgi:signal transduction histidine kinase